MAQYVTHITKGGTTRYFKDRRVGELFDLLTENSESIVAAINELKLHPEVTKQYVDEALESLEGTLTERLEGKQDTIEDLSTIRSNASKGAEADAYLSTLGAMVYALQANKQNKLVAGANISIDPETNVISATGSEGGAGVSFLEFSIVDGEIVQTEEQKASNVPTYAKVRDGERAVMAIINDNILAPLYIYSEDGAIEIDFGSYGVYEANYAWVSIDENDDLVDYEYDSTTPVTPAYLQQQGYANSSTIGLRQADGLRFYNQGGSIIVKTEDAQRNADILRAVFGGGVVNPIVIYFPTSSGREIYRYVSHSENIEAMSSEVVFERIVNGVTKRFIVHCNLMNDYQSAEVAEVGTFIPDASSDGKLYGRKDGAWAEVEGGEPSEYIKDASKSADGNTLTLTKKDGSNVVFSPSGGADEWEDLGEIELTAFLIRIAPLDIYRKILIQIDKTVTLSAATSVSPALERKASHTAYGFAGIDIRTYNFAEFLMENDGTFVHVQTWVNNFQPNYSTVIGHSRHIPNSEYAYYAITCQQFASLAGQKFHIYGMR